MQKKVLALSFLMAVILSFISGYTVSNVFDVTRINRPVDIFETISETLQEHYFYDVTEEDINQIYINHMFKIVDTFAEFYNDPYTRLESSDAFVQSQDIGIGVSIYFNERIPVISSVLYSSDAFKKLYPGDKIIGLHTTLNTIYFENLESTNEVVALLRGTLLEEKTFLIENALGIVRDVRIIYQNISPSTLDYAILNTQFSYIKISRFDAFISEDNKGTAHAFSEALKTLESEHLKENQTLIIDLRNNPGGSLSALHNKGNSNFPIGIIQQLLPYDATRSIFEFIDNQNKVTKYYGGLSEAKPYNIIVLVNSRSASASEVLAASLSTHGYQVYGEETFGKYQYQNSRTIAQINNQTFRLVYTEGQWTYDDGKSIIDHKIPIINQTLVNLKTSLQISFTKEAQEDDVSTELNHVQKLLNLIFDAQIREDGYFDAKTKQAIYAFQEVMNIHLTGKYDYQTYQKLYEMWMMYSHDVFLDLDISKLLDSYENQ